MSFRNLTRVSATGLLALGALALGAPPALPADVDFGLNLTGTTIAADASGKFGSVSVTNHGASKPEAVDVLFDVTELDASKVEIDLGECEVEAGRAACGLFPEDIPAPGETADLAVPLFKQDGATGAAGKLTVTVVVEGDTNGATASKTVDVPVGGSGVDLTVIAPDVTGINFEGEPTGKGVKPGDISVVFGFVFNQGDKIADGLKIKVTLPEQTTFAGQ